jgi:tetratricopeptide (TPR) repeat protein
VADGQVTSLARARHYVDIDRPQSALDELAHASDEELAVAQYWLVRSQALRGLDRPAEAAESARRGLDLDPDDFLLLDTLALAELDQDRFAEAVTALKAALQLAPDHPTLHAHLALVFARSGNFTAAFHVVDQALTLAPDDIGVRRARAQVAFLAKDPAAEKYVDELLERAPDDQTAHLLHGMLKARRKDFIPAARALAIAARLDPSSRGVVAAARESKVLAHPILAPVRPIWRIGRWRVWFGVLVVSGVLAATGHSTVRLIVLGAWIAVVVLSRTAPPILRWRAKRRFGGR